MRPIKLFALCSAAALLAGCQEPTQPSSEASSLSARAGTLPKITITDLGTLGGNSSSASGINAAGQIVGTSATARGESHAFRWEKGVITDLGALPGDRSSYANGINAAGQVVGYSSDGSTNHAFLWEKGVMTALGTLGGTGSEAHGINAAGQARVGPGAPPTGVG